MQKSSVVLLGMGLALAFCRAAAAAEPELHVLLITSHRAYEPARALTAALKRAVRQSGRYRPGKGDHSLEVLTATLGCSDPPDHECQQEIARKLKTSGYVWGTLSRAGGSLVAELHLWQDGKERGRTTLRYSAEQSDADDESLRRLVGGALARLEGVNSGTVALMAGTANGVVLLDDEPAGELRNGLLELAVPAGEHRLKVRAVGYAETSLRVAVVPGTRYELLVPLKREREPASAAPPAPVRTDAADETRRSAGYVGLASGGVLLAGGLYASLRSDDDTLGVVLMSVGALAAGAGSYLLLMAPSAPDSSRGSPAYRVRPELGLGPRLTRLGVGMRF